MDWRWYIWLNAISSLVQGGIIGTLLFLLGGAIIAPLNEISKIRNKLKLNKVVSIVLAVVLLFDGVLFVPTSNVSDDINEGTQISGTNSEDEPNTETTNNKTNASSDTTAEGKATEIISSSTNNEEPKKNESQTQFAITQK